MKCMIKIFLCAMLLVAMPFGNTYVYAQTAVCAYCGTKLPNGVHSSNCPYSTKPTTPKSSSNKHGTSSSVKGALLQGILGSVLAPDNSAEAEKQKAAAAHAAQQQAELASQQAAELQKAKDEAAQAEFKKMMRSFKQLDGSQGGMDFKGLPGSVSDFKTLDGSAESMAANARNLSAASTDSTKPMPAPGAASSPTPFFGSPASVLTRQRYRSVTASGCNSGSVPRRRSCRTLPKTATTTSIRIHANAAALACVRPPGCRLFPTPTSLRDP